MSSLGLHLHLHLHLHLPSKPTIFNRFCALRFTTPSPPHSPISSSPSKDPPFQSQTTLTSEHVTQVNLLIPRLCDSNQLPIALRLTTTAFLANTPLESLPLTPLIDSLTSQPDMTQPMSLLTHLEHTPTSHPYIRPISLMLLSSYFAKRKCKHALTVFRWMRRPDSPCSPDEKMYGILIEGFCRNGFVLEGLVVLRDMVRAKLVPFRDSKEWVYRGLLREARVKEAVELNGAFLSCADDDDDEDKGRERVLVALERVIAEWTD